MERGQTARTSPSRGGRLIELPRKTHTPTPLAIIRAWASCTDGTQKNYTITGKSIRNCLNRAIENAGIKPEQISHINANGWGTRLEDAIEAQILAEVLPSVPVVAIKGVCGYAGSGSAALEMITTVQSLYTGIIPAARNYSTPDAHCPIDVVHTEPIRSDKPFAVTLTFDRNGSAAAIVFEKCN